MAVQSQSDDYNRFAEPVLARSLYQCVYTNQMNLAYSLGIKEQISTLDRLNQHLQVYNTIASWMPADIGGELWSLYSDLDQPYKYPGTYINFTVDPSNLTTANKTQPPRLIDFINQASNSNYPNAVIPTCVRLYGYNHYL
jgi:hypothetical protein